MKVSTHRKRILNYHMVKDGKNTPIINNIQGISTMARRMASANTHFKLEMSTRAVSKTIWYTGMVNYYSIMEISIREGFRIINSMAGANTLTVLAITMKGSTNLVRDMGREHWVARMEQRRWLGNGKMEKSNSMRVRYHQWIRIPSAKGGIITRQIDLRMMNQSIMRVRGHSTVRRYHWRIPEEALNSQRPHNGQMGSSIIDLIYNLYFKHVYHFSRENYHSQEIFLYSLSAVNSNCNLYAHFSGFSSNFYEPAENTITRTKLILQK